MSMFDPYNEMLGETSDYTIALLTALPYSPTVSGTTQENDPAEFNFDYSDLVRVSDKNYSDIDTEGTPDYSDSVNATVELDPVCFCGTDYSDTYTIVGHAVILQSVVGCPLVMAVQPYDTPFQLGPATDCLIIDGPLEFCDFTSLSDCDWGA